MLPALDYAGKRMDGVSFKGTTRPLRNANFSRASLYKADFEGMNLSGANFSNADLSGANFSNADLRGANFKEAILRGADFSRARMGLSPGSLLLYLLLISTLVVLAIPITLSGGAMVGAIAYKYSTLGVVCSSIVVVILLSLSVVKGIDFGLKFTLFSIPVAAALAIFFALFVSSSLTLRYVEIVVIIIVSILSSMVVAIFMAVNVMIFILVRSILGEAGLIVTIPLVAFLFFLLVSSIALTSRLGTRPEGEMPGEVVNYLITQRSLNELERKGLPDDTLKKLERMRYREYRSKLDFVQNQCE